MCSQRFTVRRQPATFAIYQTMRAERVRRPKVIVSPDRMMFQEITARTAALYRAGVIVLDSRGRLPSYVATENGADAGVQVSYFRVSCFRVSYFRAHRR